MGESGSGGRRDQADSVPTIASRPPPAAPEDEERRRLRHDARGAVNQILGYAELLREVAEERGDAEPVADLERIGAASRRLLGLIDALTSAGEAPERPARASSQPDRERGPRPSAVPAPAPPPPSAERLLVVDDNESNRDVLARRLGRRGFDVATASSGPEALAALSGERFDLVLLDVMMPGMSGTEVLRELRRTRSAGELPVIMATARDASEDVVEALELGANDYVTKPLDMPVVAARVEAQLALKRARDEVARLNQRLEAAQEEITRLADSAAEALDDVEAWSSTAARQIAAALGLPELGVWIQEGQDLADLTRSAAVAPTAEDLGRLARTGQHLDRGGDRVIPVLGISGELYGAIVAPARSGSLEGPAMRLLGCFARQLGGALELRKTRRELEEAEARRRRQREEMVARGVDVLQVCPCCGACYDQNARACAEDGASLEAPPAFPYRVAERYRLSRRLGEGGMGTVFAADDERLGRSIAVKVVRAEHFDNETVRSRFEREARTVARIDHPGVVAVHDSGEMEDGSLFIVMELLRGFDLGRVIRRCGPGRPAQVARLLRQGAAALDAAHAASVLHRDVKPENVFLVGDLARFSVKIVDFGVAKELAPETRLTQTGCLVGTPLFMSPEQILCRPLDHRSDIFSFAAVAFLALTGRRVTLEERFIDVLLDLVHNEPPAVSSVVPCMPSAVDEAFRWALAKEPDDRPTSVAAWVETFVAHLDAADHPVPGWREEVLDGREPPADLLSYVSQTAVTRLDT